MRSDQAAAPITSSDPRLPQLTSQQQPQLQITTGPIGLRPPLAPALGRRLRRVSQMRAITGALDFLDHKPPTRRALERDVRIAISGKSTKRRNGENKRKPLPWVATRCGRERRVSRTSAVGCHPLREIPSLRRRRSTSTGLREGYRLPLQSGHGHWSHAQPVHACRTMPRSYRRRGDPLASAELRRDRGDASKPWHS
jgi:hypothetical protein